MKKGRDLMDKLQIAAELNFIKRNRVNFSTQADEIVKKIKKGIKPTSTDYAILLNTNQEKIDELLKLEEIKERENNGKLTNEDIDFLLSKISTVKIKKALKEALYKKADQINFAYAQEHKDEFTENELKKLEEKSKKATIKEVLVEEINEMLGA